MEVGEYIRTTNGYIRKIKTINTDKIAVTYYGKMILDKTYKNSKAINETKIKAHSKNIIDLIEVGDYVNGHKVIFDTNETEEEQCNGVYRKCIVISTSKNDDSGWKLIDLEIESVVTKEQFKEMEYRV